MAVKFREYVLSVTECQAQPKMSPPLNPPGVPRPRPKVAHNWVKDFNLHKSPRFEVILPGAMWGGSPTFFGGKLEGPLRRRRLAAKERKAELSNLP